MRARKAKPRRAGGRDEGNGVSVYDCVFLLDKT